MSNHSLCFGEKTVRIAFTKQGHGYMYYVNCAGAEFLDVCRGLWCMGVDYICAHTGGQDDYISAYTGGQDVVSQAWRFHCPDERFMCRGGYSNA